MAELAFGVGSPVFLNTHLGTGNTGKFPQAIVKDTAGTTLGTFDLDDVGDGSYRNITDFLMPNFPIIWYATKVYEDPAHTVLSDEEHDGVAIVVRKDVQAALIRNDEIQVVVKDQQESIVASIENGAEFTATVIDIPESIVATVESEPIEAVLEDQGSLVAVIVC